MSESIFTKKVLMETKPIKDAVSTIKKLSKNYNIYIITARTEKLITDVYLWLEKYEIKKYIKDIISSSYKGKQQICIEKNITYLYDDDIRHIKENKIANAILFNISHEKVNTKVQQVNSWKEIYKNLSIL